MYHVTLVHVPRCYQFHLAYIVVDLERGTQNQWYPATAAEQGLLLSLQFYLNTNQCSVSCVKPYCRFFVVLRNTLWSVLPAAPHYGKVPSGHGRILVCHRNQHRSDAFISNHEPQSRIYKLYRTYSMEQNPPRSHTT